MSPGPSLYAPEETASLGDASGASPLVTHLETGFQHLYGDDAAAAAAAFRAALALAPDNADAHGGLAEALAAAGQAGEAAIAYAAALAREPDRWAWRLGRAAALAEAGAAEAAVEAYAQLAGDRPDAAAVRCGLARALVRAGRSGDAMDEYREALFLRPDDVETAIELGALLVAAGESVAALEILQPLHRRHGEEPRLLLEIGRAWIDLREADKALSALRRASALDPDDRFGAAALVAGLEAGSLSDLTPSYVRALFDRYADRFDRDLVDRLAYRGPAVVRAAVERVCGGPTGALRVLDLGCGTGLAGLELRPFASWLAGVDLAPRMVAKAAARGVYDDTQVCDIAAAMWATPGAWDLVAAADVLVYVGDLAPVFAAAAAALRPGGRFVATAERMEDDAMGAGFALGPSRRYAHGRAHLEAAAAQAGLALMLIEPCTPRHEKQAPVPGWVFVLGKPPMADGPADPTSKG